MDLVPQGYKGTLTHLKLAGWNPETDRTSVWSMDIGDTLQFIGYCNKYSIPNKLLEKLGLDIPEGVVFLDGFRGLWLLLNDGYSPFDLANFEDWRPWILATGGKI